MSKATFAFWCMSIGSTTGFSAPGKNEGQYWQRILFFEFSFLMYEFWTRVQSNHLFIQSYPSSSVCVYYLNQRTYKYICMYVYVCIHVCELMATCYYYSQFFIVEKTCFRRRKKICCKHKQTVWCRMFLSRMYGDSLSILQLWWLLK